MGKSKLSFLCHSRVHKMTSCCFYTVLFILMCLYAPGLDLDARVWVVLTCTMPISYTPNQTPHKIEQFHGCSPVLQSSLTTE